MTKAKFSDGIDDWVVWLRQQAQELYVWDEAGSYARVKRELDTPVHATLTEAFAAVAGLEEDHHNLKHNLFCRYLEKLSEESRFKLASYFERRGYCDFQFLGHGGRAMAYRAFHESSKQIHVVRLEAPHRFRKARPRHTVVLQPFASNQNNLKAYEGVKLEALPEIVPLTKLPRRYKEGDNDALVHEFHRALFFFGYGTNMMYPLDIYDKDFDPTNVGLRPDGRIVSFDPECVRGKQARAQHERYKIPPLFKEERAVDPALIYPTSF